ncbi:MAG: carboxymuconolactone decarboxylase family protein [Thermoanaerobaculia bacterium]
MPTRLHYAKQAPGVYDAMDALDQYLGKCSLDETLLHLVRLRASQINGCAYCLDLHWRDLRALGETERRLYSLDAWRESPWYGDRERAALAWTEAVTLIHVDHAPDEVLAEARRHFSERELCDLTLAIAAINAWNRLSIAARLVPAAIEAAPPVPATAGG